MKNEELTQETSEDKYEEEWVVKITTGGEYRLSRKQALILQQEMAAGKRGVIVFKTFSIPIPYVAEFFRNKRFLKDTYKLPATATEERYVPIPEEKWSEIKRKMYEKIGKH